MKPGAFIASHWFESGCLILATSDEGESFSIRVSTETIGHYEADGASVSAA